MTGLLLILGLGGVIFLGLLVAQVMWTLTHPPRRTFAWAVARQRPSDPSEIESSPEFESWSFQGCAIWDVTGERDNGPTIIVTHGWGDSRLGGLTRLDALLPHAARVVLWEMPGHGESDGACSLGVREIKVLGELIDEIGDGPIVLYGWSLGAGISIAAASRDEVAGVIAEAPYRRAITPARNVMTFNHLPHHLNLPIAFWILGVRFGVGPGWREFDRAQWASKVRCPLLVIHGSEDEICPVQDGREIAEAAPAGEFALIEGAGHNNLWSEPEYAKVCRDAIDGFLTRLAPRLSSVAR